jgi:hypothetical protein
MWISQFRKFQNKFENSVFHPSLTLQNMPTPSNEIFCPENLEVSRIIAYDEEKQQCIIQ